jgi:pentose-5-phosphate-3-epimerase
VKEQLVAQRIRTIKAAGAMCAVSVVPSTTKKLAPVAQEAGADILVVQSTVTSARSYIQQLPRAGLLGIKADDIDAYNRW